ncbi:hypothetical protein Acr_26g0002320 [Actinidia rufa]|uniref:Uncharacterized protein n=1 Tax=Actinidia rufa TaxID=165716 RepID=A0A7J0H1P3_9ERIC|nr:hypothetical protein Acr_26g0002320 [Actinidia rufa]
MGWAIALHGGAGDIPLDLPPERREPREAALRHCLDIGVAALSNPINPLWTSSNLWYNSISLSLPLSLLPSI